MIYEYAAGLYLEIFISSISDKQKQYYNHRRSTKPKNRHNNRWIICNSVVLLWRKYLLKTRMITKKPKNRQELQTKIYVNVFLRTPLAITIIYDVNLLIAMTDNPLDEAAKKMKNSQQDAKAEAETAQNHAEGKPSSETLNKAKEKVKDAFS
jgi:hypothetical protein